MAFMMKKKKYKFSVDLCLEEITAVPFVNGVLFAKVRLLDGNFVDTSSREEVKDHKVRWGANFSFVCKMSANASTGIMEPCVLRISVRKEAKGGRSFVKLGFSDLNLAEFAPLRHTQRRCLLEGYDTRHRQDNSMLSLTIAITMLSGDILFKVPSSTVNHKPAVVDASSGEDSNERMDQFSGNSILTGAPNFSSLNKKNRQHYCTEVADPPEEPAEQDEGLELTHSRNSSSTSQVSKTSLQSHSRHSSGSDSGHIRCVEARPLQPLTPDPPRPFRFPPWSLGSPRHAASSPGLLAPSPPAPRNSCLSETGSLDRGKAALERRKKAAEDGTRPDRVEGTRVNPDSLIDQLIRSTNLENPDDSAETSGLQLFIAKDGTTALGSEEVKNQISTGVFKQVVIEENR